MNEHLKKVISKKIETKLASKEQLTQLYLEVSIGLMNARNSTDATPDDFAYLNGMLELINEIYSKRYNAVLGIVELPNNTPIIHEYN